MKLSASEQRTLDDALRSASAHSDSGTDQVVLVMGYGGSLLVLLAAMGHLLRGEVVLGLLLLGLPLVFCGHLHTTKRYRMALSVIRKLHSGEDAKAVPSSPE